MKRKPPIIVTKRDGTLERFRPAKLANCLARAMEQRQFDPKLAEPLVRAVALHLREWGEARPPSTGYIHRCVCAVLKQTGLSDIADDLAVQRRLRAIKRRKIRVLDNESKNPRGREWRKADVVEMLQNQYGLRHGVCRFLAGQVESQVFALNYRRVRTAFLAELVRSEVLAWGLADEQALSVDDPAVVPPVATREPERPKQK